MAAGILVNLYTYRKLMVGVLLLHELYKLTRIPAAKFFILKSWLHIKSVHSLILSCTIAYGPVVADISTFAIKRSKPVSPQKLSKKTETRFIRKNEREVVSELRNTTEDSALLSFHL